MQTGAVTEVAAPQTKLSLLNSAAFCSDGQVSLPPVVPASDWPRRADFAGDDDDSCSSSLRYFAGAEESAGGVEGGAAAAEPDASGGVARRGSDGNVAGSDGSCGGGPNSGARGTAAAGEATVACVLVRGTSV